MYILIALLAGGGLTLRFLQPVLEKVGEFIGKAAEEINKAKDDYNKKG